MVVVASSQAGDADSSEASYRTSGFKGIHMVL